MPSESEPSIVDGSDVVRMAAEAQERQRKFIADTEAFTMGNRTPLSPEPVASTSPSSAVGMAGNLSASFRMSGTPTVTPARAEPNPAQPAVILEQRLPERPDDIREAARALSKAIADQIDLLNASKPNDPDAVARHDDLIAFLRQIAERLDRLADALDGALNATSSEGAASAASIARSIGDFVREGLEKHRPALQACSIYFPVLAGCVALLHALGVDANIAFGTMATIMGVKGTSKDGAKK